MSISRRLTNVSSIHVPRAPLDPFFLSQIYLITTRLLDDGITYANSPYLFPQSRSNEPHNLSLTPVVIFLPGEEEPWKCHPFFFA